MRAERIFQVLSAVLAGAAVYFLWNGNYDGMFAAAVVGACCFFLSVRFQVVERVKKREAERDSAEEQDEEDINGRPEAGNHETAAATDSGK